MASKRKGYVDANLYIADVESIALSRPHGEETRTGFIVIRCIAREDR